MITIDKLTQNVIAGKLNTELQIQNPQDINTEMLDALGRMNQTTVNRSYREIPAAGFVKKILRLFKRLMRRLTFWYVEPCMIQQTEYNIANTKFSAEVNSEINTLRMAVLSGQEADAREEQKLSELQETAELLQRQLKDMQQHIREMELFYQNVVPSFSQCGEDAIVRYIFHVLGIQPENCRYLDLGANHAMELSNTYQFYRAGARGVLVEANPVLAEELSSIRQGDIVLNLCLSDKKEQDVDFYIMSGDGLSTSDYNAVQEMLQKNPALSIEKKISVSSITMEELLTDYFEKQPPDILNLDVEGLELSLLRAIDFEKCRPKVLICEMIAYRTTLTVGEKNMEILEFMQSNEYEEFAFTGINSIFIDRRILNQKEGAV